MRIARRTSGTISTSHTDPHTFLTLGVGVTPGLQTQHQIGTFLPTGVTVDPDGLLPQFEVPINGPLPEELNF